MIDVFTGLSVPKVPGPPAIPFWVVSEWTGPRGAEIPFAVDVREARTRSTIGSYPGTAKIGPANKAQPVVKIDKLVFPNLGEYQVEIAVAGRVLISEPLSVMPVVQ